MKKEVITLYRPGDELKDVGLVQKTIANLAWPSDVYGNMYMGCVVVERKVYDAHTGNALAIGALAARRNNMEFNYNDAYKPSPAVEQTYRTLLARAIITSAMYLEAEASRGVPDEIRWDSLKEGERMFYIDTALVQLGISRTGIPAQEMEFIDNLVRKVRPATASELAIRRAGLKS